VNRWFTRWWPNGISSLFDLGGCDTGFIQPHDGFVEAAVVSAKKLTEFYDGVAGVRNEPAPA
jgi:hypothetical protein